MQDILTVQPNRDQFGRRILIIELGSKYLLTKLAQAKLIACGFLERWKHNKCSLDEVFKGCVLFVEIAMLEPATQVAGAVVIFDMDGLSLQQTWQFTPPFAKRIVDWLQVSIITILRRKLFHSIHQDVYCFRMAFRLG